METLGAAEQGGGRQLDVFEDQPPGRGGADAHGRLGLDAEAGGLGLDDEQRRTRALEVGGDDEQLALGGAGHERLGARQDVAAPGGAGGRCQRERVEQRARLHDRDRRGRNVLADELGEVGGLLLLVAPQAERRGDRGGGQTGDGDAHVSLGERLAHQHGGGGRALLRRRRRAPRARRPWSDRARRPGASRSGGVAQAASASGAALRSRARANSRTESRSIRCSSEGSRSKRSLRGARGWRAGRDRRWAAAKVRPARAAVRPVVLLAPCSRRTAGSRRPRRSMAEEEATLLRARRPTAMPFSAMFCSGGIAGDHITNRCDVVQCNAERIRSVNGRTQSAGDGRAEEARRRSRRAVAYGVLTSGSSC